MAAKTFNTSNDEYRKLMANGTVYRIPRFQRDYSWNEENWEDLWLDILEVMDDKDVQSHYMGYLVLQQKGETRSIDVIDGQQRLTTISILILSALRLLNKVVEAGVSAEENRRRIDEIRRTYIGQVDPVSLQVRPKLTLNRNNDSYFQTYLVPLRVLPQRGLKESVHRLRKASEWFERKIDAHLLEKCENDADRGPYIAAFVEKLSDRLFFTVITVADELNAYKVFETLNARGVKLSAPDLLKNYLFSVVSKDSAAQDDGELDALEARWAELLSRLASENITGYLRTYWGARHQFVREAELFKVIKKSVSTRAAAYELLQGLEDDVETYLALSSPDQSSLSAEDKTNAALLKLFSVRQPFALLMSVKRKLPNEFSKVLRAIVNISFRYNVIGSLQAAEQERTYSRAATSVAKGDFGNFAQIILSLKNIYPNDEIFFASFSTKEFDTSNTRNKNVVKYLLGELERQEMGAAPIDDSDLTIEHILPENPSDGWDQFADNEVATFAFRLGNMTLVEEPLNKKMGNQPFSIKRDFLKLSGVMSTRSIGDLDGWIRESIDTRQRRLAKTAKTVWRVDNLS